MNTQEATATNNPRPIIANGTATVPDMELVEKHRKEIKERENERNTI